MNSRSINWNRDDVNDTGFQQTPPLLTAKLIRALQLGPMAGPVHSFGPFRYDASQRVLFREDQIIPLVPKVTDTLEALLEHRGRVIEKAELMKLVWGETNVEESGLARNISLLRKALGDDAGELYVETVPKRGYRFVAPPAEAAAPAAGPRRLWVLIPILLAAVTVLIYWQFYAPSRYLHSGRGAATLAVVPFEVLGTSDPTASEELNEVLVAGMSRFNTVQVISPSTVRRYQRLGISPALMSRLLFADVILEGTIHQDHARTRISARLADVHSGRIIWADTYDLSGDNPVDPEITRSITAQVGAHLSNR